MRRASWACCATERLRRVAGGLLVLLVAWLAWAGQAQARNDEETPPLVRYTEAEVQVVQLGTRLPDAGIVRPDASEPGWRPVALPDIVPREAWRGPPQDRRWLMHWYLVRYVLPPRGASPPLAVYVPRVNGGPAEVHVNGRLLMANRDDWTTQWNRPLYVPVPHDVIFTSPGSAVEVEVIVGLPWREGQALSMSSIWVGSTADLRPIYDRRYLLQVTAPQVTSLTILVLGIFSFGFWWRRRARRETAYLLFAITSAVWWLRNLHYHVVFPDPGPANDWFWWLTHASLSWVMVLNYIFAFRFHHRRYRAVETAMVAFTLLISAGTVPLWPWEGLVAQHLLNALVSLFATGFITWVAFREGSRELRVLSLALWASVALGVHDLLLVSLRITPESIYLMPYATLLVFGAFLYAVLRRYAGAVEEVERINASLEQRLADRTVELERNHERLRQVEREQAMLLERQRLMRDMHDGMGSALMSSLVLVEQGRLDIPAVAAVLRECVDDLRLVIDSLEPIGHDLVTLLATLRYRLGRRLESAGLVLEWQVDDLPQLPWLDPTAALQVLRIVQEALTNVLKHARAHTVRIEMRKEDDRVEVNIMDDGAGFDVEAMLGRGEGGRGLRNLRKRAQALGGDVSFVSQPGSTRVTLLLPLVRE